MMLEHVLVLSAWALIVYGMNFQLNWQNNVTDSKILYQNFNTKWRDIWCDAWSDRCHLVLKFSNYINKLGDLLGPYLKEN